MVLAFSDPGTMVFGRQRLVGGMWIKAVGKKADMLCRAWYPSSLQTPKQVV
jgi:hypothetical protein